MILDPPNGADVAFSCTDHDGTFFFCKADRNGRFVRATEMVFTRLAKRLGIRTAAWAVIEHEGDTFFGSQQEVSSVDGFRVAAYLASAQQNELGQPSSFPGQYLAQVLAFDLFVGNSDRSHQNFLLVRDGAFQRICAIDFADSELANLATSRFAVAQSKTVLVGKRYRSIHGAFAASGIEMVDRIEALPAQAFSRIIEEVPEDWLPRDVRGGLDAVWGSPGFQRRLATLRAGLADGTLV